MSAFNTKENVSVKKDLSKVEVSQLQEQSGGSDNNEEDEDEEDGDEDGDEDEDDDEQSGGSSHVAIDLSENEIYKGICTLFEDENGNNILEYISLLHSELIGHNKTMKSIKKDLSRIADCAEIMAKKMK
jgi:hypothetical protein